ncbi:hypothetical protein BD309DRAFT_73275 [Dichomitus squalens]|nr:hypothetical protein BD309DRAFT_73275 [Dichomitus squalens]
MTTASGTLLSPAAHLHAIILLPVSPCIILTLIRTWYPCCPQAADPSYQPQPKVYSFRIVCGLTA